MAPKTNSAGAHFPPTDSDAHSIVAEHSALATAKQALTFLIDPSKANSATRPQRLRTRALLRTLHYFGKFLFWKLYRWAKYALVGSAVAAVGSMVAAGSMATGVGFLMAPGGIVASAGFGTVYGLARFAWRRIHRKKMSTAQRGLSANGTATKAYAKEPDLQEVPW